MKKSAKIAIVYFLIHFLVEIVSFATVFNRYSAGVAALVALLFDGLAFVPQGIIGDFMNKHRKFDMGTVGVFLMLFSLVFYNTQNDALFILEVFLVAIGNACLHECGAVATVTVSEGKLFPTALFVGGGSFGVITGQILGKNHVSAIWLIACVVVIELLVLFSNKRWLSGEYEYPTFNIVDKEKSLVFIMIIALLVTTVRSFIGYVIPISWNKQTWQAVLLFVMMGLGKAFGGLAADLWGARKVGLISTVLAIPFLIFGNNYMVVSFIGVFMFSMTMSLTFGMLLSIIGDNPGVAFGITTVGLFLGIIPSFFIQKFSITVNIILVIVLSLLCFEGFRRTLSSKK